MTSDRGQRTKATQLVVLFGVLVSTLCGIMGFPCAPGLPTLLFRLTCVGYFSGCVAGLYVVPDRWQKLTFRAALISNSLASWVVSKWWCLDFGEWAILMLLEHAFMVVGVIVLPGDGMLIHLFFTFQGSITLFATRDSDGLMEVPMESRRFAKHWIATIIFTVGMLVVGMAMSGYWFMDTIRKKVLAIHKVLSAPDDMCQEERITGSTSSGASTVISAPSSSRSPSEVGEAPFPNLAMGKKIGAGSFGTVSIAEYEGKTVAVKITRWTAESRKKAKAMSEALLSSSLSHRNLVQTIDFASTEHDEELIIWTIQEMCDMGTLGAYCDRRRCDQAGVEEVFYIMEGICAGGVYLHDRGIVHGDLTGNNVLRKSDGNSRWAYCVKVCDFGLAKVIEGVSTGVLTTQVGTVSHMPPEMFSIDQSSLVKFNTPVDIYSAGILLWQACTGEFPFPRMSSLQIILFVERGNRLKLTDTSPFLIELFSQITNDNPKARPSFKELYEIFRRPPQSHGCFVMGNPSSQ